MATVVEMPRLSDTMEEGVIAKWHVKEGDKVKRGQLIAEVETDKATMEFESFDAGHVLRLVAPEGETLPIGAPIAVLGKQGRGRRLGAFGRRQERGGQEGEGGGGARAQARGPEGRGRACARTPE